MRLHCFVIIMAMLIKNLLFFFTLLFCFFSYSALIYAQTPSPTATPTPTPTIHSQTQSDGEKIAILQAQLELMRQYDQRLLNTVYYTLAALGTVVFLIVTLGWYTNFRLYKRDNEALKQEVISSLAAEARQAAEKVAAQMFNDLNDIKFELLKLEANQWEAEGVYGNVLGRHVEMAEVSSERGYDWRISRALGEMMRVLKIIVNNEKHSTLDGDTAIKITRMLDGLSAEHSADVDIIRQLVRSARAK